MTGRPGCVFVRWLSRLTVLALAFECAAGNGLEFRQVALTGDPAPGASDGAVIGAVLASPVLNQNNDVAFSAILQTGPSGVPVTSLNNHAVFGVAGAKPSALAVRFREGFTVPVGAGPDAGIGGAGLLTLNGRRELAFGSALRFGDERTFTIANSAIFQQGGGAGDPVNVPFRYDDPVPGVTDGAVFSGVGSIPPVLNSSGDLAFVSFFRSDLGSPVNDANNSAVLGPVAGPGSAVEVLAREGDLAPGTNGEARFRRLSWLSLNDRGQSVFWTKLRESSSGFTEGDAIYRYDSGLNLLGRDGDPVPGASDGAAFGRFSKPSINAFGDVVVSGALQTGAGTPVTAENDGALFTATGGSDALRIALREGDPAPGARDLADFGDFFGAAINDRGDLAFSARLRTGAAFAVTFDNDQALFGPTGDPAAPLALIARENDRAPDAPGAEFAGFGDFVLNDRGDVVFFASLRSAFGGSVDFRNDQAVYAHFDGRLHLVARTGDPFVVDPADGMAEARTIGSIDYAPSLNGRDGEGLALNDAGLFTFALGFTDGTSGVFTTFLPETTAGIVLLSVVTGLRGRRSRR